MLKENNRKIVHVKKFFIVKCEKYMTRFYS